MKNTKKVIPTAVGAGAVGDENVVESIPYELVFDIFTRLPVRSLGRFKSVSAHWNSTISSDTSFIRSHFSHSLSIRPNNPFTLLITFPNRFDLERLIYSATIQPQTLTKSELQFCLAVPGFGSRPVSQSLHGFICFDVGSSGLRVCNPSTRQFISLPTTESETHYDPLLSHHSTTSFGFDPVSYQHKAISTWIICKEDPANEIMITEHRVCTLGNSEQKQWRRINGGQPHFPFTESVCINGFVYYRAYTRMMNPGKMVLAAFDVGREEFSFIPLPYDWVDPGKNSVLIECDGKLGLVNYHELKHGSNHLEMWVLKDEEKGIWDKKILMFPPNWNEGLDLYLNGTLQTGEMIFAPRILAKPFYLFFYDTKSSCLRKVEICGFPEFEFRFGDSCFSICVYDHVESVLSLA